jgi:3-isopropylmalate/(R)-2-methylmalate dehydratase large subunit
MSTITEKILSAHADTNEVEPGEIIKADIDLAMMPALTAVLAFRAMEEIGVSKVWDSDRVIILLDHIAPATNVTNAALHRECRILAKEQDLKYFYDINAGVCHQILPEQGHVFPSMLLVGADSHTCTHGAFGAFATGIGSTDMGAALATGKLWFKVPETMKVNLEGSLQGMIEPKDIILKTIGEVGADGATYMAVEFTGSTIKEMSMAGRMTLCNMAIEMGGKSGIVEPDETTIKYLEGRVNHPYEITRGDSEAEFSKSVNIDANMLEPMVSLPHSVDNVKAISEIGEIEIDQVFIGSCTNGRLEDLISANKILKGKKIANGTRLIVTPASFDIYHRANNMGIIDDIMKAGGVVANPSCGACFGGNNAILAPGERGLSTSNRNFRGRQGSPEAEVYLCSPSTAAASSITGRVTDPREVI